MEQVAKQFPPIRVASYNIRKCVGLDRRRNPARILRVLAALDADIIALQEADRRLGPRPAALPRHMIETHGGYAIAPLGVNPVSLGWHGNAILLRRGLTLGGVQRIALPGLEPRGAVLAEIRLPQGDVRINVVGVHLGLLRRNRRAQLSRLCQLLEHARPLPTIVMGDFNEWSPRAALAPLDSRFGIIAPGHSFHAARPLAMLDRIAHDPFFQVRDSGVLAEGEARHASDHLPVWADLAWPAQAMTTRRR